MVVKDLRINYTDISFMEDMYRNLFDDAKPAKGDMERFLLKARKNGIVDVPEPGHRHRSRTAFTVIAANFACFAAVLLIALILNWNSDSDSAHTSSRMSVVPAVDYFKGVSNATDPDVLRSTFIAKAVEMCCLFDSYDQREVSHFASSIINEPVPFETTLPEELDEYELASLIKNYYNKRLNALNEAYAAYAVEIGNN